MMISRRRLDEGDFDAWKDRFEAQVDARREAGCRGVRRFRGIEDPREIIVIFDWESIDKAKGFVGMKLAEKPELTEARDDGAGAKLENIFMEEMPELPG
jgi:heme-degrading monooxygenase HmoA